jgi:2-polyprenyl-3-methyl-5-hydroxy-6-metoxy-1,4-benzoquinol methylase
MKKYNRAEIFRKAWRLVKVYGMSMSAALRKSWQMARLEILENEYFLLNMKDLDGGRTNTAAQTQIRENNERLNELNKQIIALKQEIYPTVRTEQKFKFMSIDFDKVESKMKNIAYEFGTDDARYVELAKQLEQGYRIDVYEKLDTNAYDAA